MSETYDGVKFAVLHLVATGQFDPDKAVKDAVKEYLAEHGLPSTRPSAALTDEEAKP